VSHELSFEPEKASPSDARSFVAHWTSVWGYRHLVPTAALLTSELVTNAVFHTGAPFTVSVDNTGQGVRVAVIDGSPVPPVVRATRDEDEHGRGMHIVDQLASEWGTDPVPGGKQVWFKLAFDEASNRL
jgi:anti-sigma regulatory factor (Ser/Thr protein kinase)